MQAARSRHASQHETGDSRKLYIAAVAALVVVAVAIVGWRSRPADLPSGRANVEAVRIEPRGGSREEVECASLSYVQFTYQVHNRGHSPLTGLRVGTHCSCEELGTPPARIAPNESAPISFRLRAPYAGRLQRAIPLLADGSSEPVALIDVSLAVKFEPPALVAQPTGFSFTFVAGSRSRRELMLEAMETKADACWILGLELDSADGIEVQPPVVEELPQPDRDLTLRRYHFALVNRSLPVGRQTVVATVQTRDGAPTVPNPIIMQVDVADSVAIVPNPLVIKYRRGSPPPSRRICVVRRDGGKADAGDIDYNHELLRIDAAETMVGSTAAFDVVPLKMPESPLETQVVFKVENNGTRELAIRFEPAEQP